MKADIKLVEICHELFSSGVESIVISENSLEDAYNQLTTGGQAWSNDKLKGFSLCRSFSFTSKQLDQVQGKESRMLQVKSDNMLQISFLRQPSACNLFSACYNVLILSVKKCAGIYRLCVPDPEQESL